MRISEQARNGLTFEDSFPEEHEGSSFKEESLITSLNQSPAL